MSWRWGIVLAFASTSFASVLAVQPSATTAPSWTDDTPLAAARRFAAVYGSSDRAALRTVVCGKTPGEEHAADIWAESMSAQVRLQQVIKTKLGEKEYAAFYGNPPR